MSDIYLSNYTGARATDRGTKIVKAGEEMNKNSFLKILSAELANLDPSANNDSTQYVTQLAQFANMEQTSNLNQTMADSAAYQLVGKGVTMKSVDSTGMPYTGVVQGVSSSNGSYKLQVEVNENGTNQYKEFSIEDIATVLDVPDYSIPPLSNMNGNISMLVAASYIGKNVQLSETNDAGQNLTGKVLGVSKKNGEVLVKVQLDGSDETKEISYDKVINVSETPFNNDSASEA